MFEVAGTHNLFGNATPDPWVFQGVLDPSKFHWVGVDYPGDVFPMAQSVATGVANLQAAINGTPGQIILFGDSQGAQVCSDVFDWLHGTTRMGDFLGAVTFGNPRRTEGHTFPGCPDPGGHGLDAMNLLGPVPVSWWDFAVPGDIITCCPDTAAGTVETAVFDVLMNTYNGNIWTLLLTEGFNTAIAVFQLIYTLTAGHSYSHNTTFFPLNDGQTIMQLATAHINSLAM